MRKKSNKKRTYKKKLPKKSRKLKKPKYKKNGGTLKKILSRRIKTEPPNPNTLVLNPYFDPYDSKPNVIIMTQRQTDTQKVTKEKLCALKERYNNPQFRRKIYSKVNEFNPKGIDSQDIADVMEMAGVQKGKAVQALRQNFLEPELAFIKLNKIDLEPDDIKVLMDEAGVTEFEATYYLKKHNGNYLNAITEAMSN